MLCSQDVDAAPASSTVELTGIFQPYIKVSEATSITCVTVPLFDASKPVKGTKEARNAFFKLLTGMNNDVNPLNLRTECEYKSTVPDKYFKFAPGWSTLGWGREPQVVLPPGVITRYVVESMSCIPYYKTPIIEVITGTGSSVQKSVVTPAQLEDMAIPMKPVPKLYIPEVCSSPRSNLAPQLTRPH